jgi:hypothetical protein
MLGTIGGPGYRLRLDDGEVDFAILPSHPETVIAHRPSVGIARTA